MGTSRSKSWRAGVGALAAIACLACSPGEEAPAAAIATIVRQPIDPVTPKRDAVGPAPTRLEWTAVAGADSYNISVATEIDGKVFDYRGATGTSIPWPTEITLQPGTYFWRVVAMQEGRTIADSGRSAFVVTE